MKKFIKNIISNKRNLYILALVLVLSGIGSTILVTHAASKRYALIAENIVDETRSEYATFTNYWLSDNGNVYVRMVEYLQKNDGWYGDKIYSVKTKANYKSSNTSVATVSRDGKLKLKKAGKTTISCKYNGKTYKTTIYIKNDKPNLSNELFQKYNDMSLYAQGIWLASKAYTGMVEEYEERTKNKCEHCYILGWDIMNGDLTGDMMGNTSVYIDKGVEVAIPRSLDKFLYFDTNTRELKVRNLMTSVFHGYIYLNRTKVSIYLNCQKDEFADLNDYENSYSYCQADEQGFKIADDGSASYYDYIDYECDKPLSDAKYIGRAKSCGLFDYHDDELTKEQRMRYRDMYEAEKCWFKTNCSITCASLISYKEYNSYKRAFVY